MIKFGRNSNIVKGISGNKKKKDVNQLSITSLLDVMTILLIFMIKNVSMDAAQRNAPNGMLLPSTITNDELIKKGNVIYVRMYTDKILYGTDNIEVGTLQEFVEDKRVRNTLLGKLENEVKFIKGNDQKPVLLIQADKKLKCKYVIDFIEFSTRAKFADIYFSTIEKTL
ncbi:MAG: biopolymer transporter ExbD [Candidatus Cloacimonetes bacterium]|nr:biopolymer transporter ExbD [Candidatus Cloacimonadota bacterium]